MTTTAEKFETAAAAFARRVADVPTDRWDQPSPCPPWTARDLVDHVIDGCGHFLGVVGRPLALDAGAPPDERWAEVRQAVAQALDDPDTCGAAVASPIGELAFKQVVGSVILHDVLVHTWDLARATGQDETLDAALVASALERMTPFDAYLRGPAMFGPRIDAPADADVQTRFLAFVGRSGDA